MHRLHAPSKLSVTAPARLAWRRLAGLLGLGTLTLALLAALAACGEVGSRDGVKDGAKAATKPPAKVGVVTVAASRHVERVELPGRTRARLVAEIRPQVSGIVRERLFEEGSHVKAGEALYQIDPATFEVAVAMAQAGLNKAEAALQVARVSERRLAELARLKAASQQEHDDSRGALMAAEAELAGARAALQDARIALARTRITSPIAGRVEASAVSVGALVTANQATPLTVVQQRDPLYVDVSQSSAQLLRLKQRLASGALRPGAVKDAPIRLVLEDGSTYPHEGRLQVSGGTVDAGTGAVTLRALVPNPDGLLMPGMYVRATLDAGVIEQAVLVPQQGVSRTPTGEATALVVGEGNKVERRTLQLGDAVGAQWHVVKGLQAGERLIVEGVQGVKPGDVVQPLAAGR